MRLRQVFFVGLAAAGLSVPAQAALGPAAAAGSTVLGPLVEAFLARHIDVFALAPVAAPPLEVAALPPDSMGPGGERRLPYPGAPGEPSPRPRPSGAPPAETVEVPTPSAKVADTLQAAINTYQRFKAGIMALAKLRLDQPPSIRQAQKLLAGQNQAALSRGWVGSFGQAAAKVSEFAAGLTGAAAKETPDALKTRLEQKPGDVWQVAGAANASSAVVKQVASDLLIMESVAYRLVDLSSNHETSRQASSESGNYFSPPAPPAGDTTPEAKKPATQKISELSAAMRTARSTGDSPAKSLMAQILAVGARMQLSQAGALPDPASASHAETDQCLRWAQLNLAQCLAAAHDNTERGWCLGAIGIHDRAKCWASVAGAGS
ncbi:MAG: hypothetical protein U1E87_05735 [Alphaproteobacteria bacterium]